MRSYIIISSLTILLTIFCCPIFSQNHVGVNTDDPQWPLHVWDPGQVPSTLMALGDDVEARMEFGFDRIQSKTDLSALPMLLQPEGGRVGINTSGLNTPLAPLHVWDGGQVSSTLLMLGHGTEARMEVAFDKIQSKTSASALPLYLQHEGGNLGIGPALPVSKLHVSTGVDASYSTHGYLMTGSLTGTNLIIDENEILARNNGAASHMFIQRDGGDLLLSALKQGGVGIGISSSTSMPDGYLLAVDGKAIFEELRIELSEVWPDYVFDHSYSLRPLDQLEKEIQNLGRLPGIPSAMQIEIEGLDVGEMQRLMMEKIEELTLYVIQLHKENADLQRQIDALGLH